MTAWALLLVLGADPAFGAKPAIAKGTGVVVELKDEREIKGIYLGRRDGAVWLGLDGGEIGVEPSTIRKITPVLTPDAEFLARKAALPPGDAAAWWELAAWAQSSNLPESARSAALHVISIQPDHTRARVFLGHGRYNGKWMTFEECQRSKGLVYYEGTWLTSKQVEAIGETRRGIPSTHVPTLDENRSSPMRGYVCTQESANNTYVHPGPAARPKKKAVMKGSGAIIFIRGGNEVSGLLIGEKDGAVIIGVDHGEVVIDKATILRMEARQTPEEEFLQKKNALESNDVDGRMALIRWAQESGLDGTADAEAYDLLVDYPNYSQARSFLRHKGQLQDANSAVGKDR